MIDIGKTIREELKRQGRSVVWFARELSCNRSRIYKIFASKSINSHDLYRISVILQRDFFAIYSEYMKNREKV